ncbi:hypothetical protein [Actinomarinicola tropica]|uniref:Uncharacterized protein n=1 Tax=Actinomarinicola tropica TaxID=2789776 RepID=A0A5Q2RCF9_9ACTN|nr:hypothetical protein [Actinomarinicola tropica]QGG94579.1 hypothetical protein GH723_05350 [Actinomarinicola tropica]
MDDDQPPEPARRRAILVLAAIAVAILGVGEIAPSLTTHAVAPVFDDSTQGSASGAVVRQARRRTRCPRRVRWSSTRRRRRTRPAAPCARWQPRHAPGRLDPPRRGPPSHAVL